MFFLRDENGGVHLEDGEGLFFMSPDDAQAKLAGLKDVGGTKVMSDERDDASHLARFETNRGQGEKRKRCQSGEAMAWLAALPSAFFRVWMTKTSMNIVRVDTSYGMWWG